MRRSTRWRQRLEKQGFITNASVFQWYAERQGDIVLTPGYYQLKPKDSMSNMLDSLKTPPAQTFTKVTLPRGLHDGPDGRPAAERTCPASTRPRSCRSPPPGQIRSQYQPEGVNSLEGLLFPDTYQVAGNEDETSVVRRMVAQMDRSARRTGSTSRRRRSATRPTRC